MNKAMILDHLEMAERHVSEGERHISRQRELVSELDRDGHDTAEARKLLTTFEELQELHVSDRDRLRAELAEVDRD